MQKGYEWVRHNQSVWLAQPVRKSKRSEALEFAKALRNDLYQSNKPLSVLLLQCRTICKYLDRMAENEWIELELDGYYGKYNTNEIFIENVPSYRKVYPIFYSIYGKPIPLPYALIEPFSKYMALGSPIAQIENSEVLSMTSGSMLDELNKFLNKQYEKSGMRERNVILYAQYADNHLRTVVAGLKKRIADFVDEIILELEYGEIPEEIFQTLRAEVDQKLANLSPSAIEKLKNAYEKVGTSGSTEDWSHVASTCRRVLKDVADVVFPAQDKPQVDEDGKEHKLDDSKYVNRIIAGIYADMGKGKDERFTKSMIEYIGHFLSGIQEYASKGDHATFQKTDAVRCLVYTYMLLGDILNYHVDKDKRNVGETKTTNEEPDITIVNFYPERVGRNQILKLFPNFRNDGISARNIKIYYKVMKKIVDLKEIIAQEKEIKKSVMVVPGTVRHGDSVNLNDGSEECGIPLNTDELKSVIIWMTYDFADGSNSEVVFDLRYREIKPVSKHPIRYTLMEIEDARRTRSS